MTDSNGSPAKPSLAIVAPSAYLLGGVQTWLDYLVPGLEARGWTVTVLLVHGAHSDAHAYLRRHPFPRARLVENRSGSREGRVRALEAAIRAAGADVVLVVNIVDAYEAVARLRNPEIGKPKVAMALHGLHPSFYEDIAAFRALIDGVIATNRLATLAAALLGGIADSRAHYAPGGVEIREPVAARETSEDLLLLYAGRFDHEKNVLDLPSILRALSRRGVRWRLRLAGSGPAEDELRAALAQFGANVEFVGILDEARMRDAFYEPGAIALILSSSETGPLVAWECLANGVAVVSSRFTGIRREGGLRDGETCLTFPVGDTEAAAGAIARLVDPLFRRTLVDAGRRVVKERYSREASIRAWNDALRQVLGARPISELVAVAEAPASGRLDRWLGTRRAESVRQMVGLKYPHREAGGEWPHSYGSNANEAFREKLRALDRPETADVG